MRNLNSSFEINYFSLENARNKSNYFSISTCVDRFKPRQCVTWLLQGEGERQSHVKRKDKSFLPIAQNLKKRITSRAGTEYLNV